jgi:hypothetical protein
MTKFFRLRNVLLVGGTFAVVTFMYLSDPNGGALSTMLVAQLATPIIAVLFAHMARKALFDYMDLKSVYLKAKETSIGAAIIFIGVCLIIFALLGLFGNQVKAQNVTTYIPAQAQIYVPMLREEQQTLWVSHPKLNYSHLSLSTKAALA